MSYEYSEEGLVEAATQEVLEELGWKVVTAWKKETLVTAQIKIIISNKLQWLPPAAYPDDEVIEKADLIYQHIFTNYRGNGYKVA